MEMIYGAQRGPVAHEDLPDVYPWPERAGRAWVRAMMVGTLDGAAAGADGLSGSISGCADGEVFSAVRRFADVVLVGGGTLTAEEYGPLGSSAQDARRRRDAGQAEAPVLAVVSGSLTLPLDEDGFTASTVRPLVFTTADPDPDRLAALRERCEVVQADGEVVDVAWVIDRLVERGLWRVVCEGGPSLLRDVAQAGRLDEVDLTLSPTAAGTGTTPRTDVLSAAPSFALQHVLSADDFLMTRYLRAEG